MTAQRIHRSAGLLALVLAAASVPLSALADNAGAHKASSLATDNGEQIYRHVCQGCHMPNGEGAVGAGHYPAFAGNPALASAPYMALTVLHGRRDMPAFAPRGSGESFGSASLTDAQVAGVINYIRTHFGNRYTDPISATEVQALHPPKP